MNTKRFTGDSNAVHPIVAVLLMVTITVVLAAVLYTWALSFIVSDKQTPTLGAVSEPHGTNDFAVHVQKVDPDAVRPISVTYILLDDQGRAVPGVQGSVDSIYCGNPEFGQMNVTFLDEDRDGRLSAGDVFIVISKENGGQAEEGYSLLLKFEVTGDKMNGGGTRLVK